MLRFGLKKLKFYENPCAFEVLSDINLNCCKIL
jgi:hypothetical protein